MDVVRINRSKLVGKNKSKSAVIQALIRANALNRSGNINYNEYGKLDGIGFEKVSEKFVDNFIFKVLVPDYNVKEGKNLFVGSQNKTIRELLQANGLEKCVVQAIRLMEIKNEKIEEKMKKRIPNEDFDKVAKQFYIQEFKIASPNIKYSTVMDFLRCGNYQGHGFILNDIDITLDYAGSFDKHKCVQYLTTNKEFREQGSMLNGMEYPRTILENDGEVGRNCLTWMEEVDGMKTRQKIYNKMVQMLESKSVRSDVGSHWKDWVCQKGTRLATARDNARDRGLTRAEVTFYMQNTIPNDVFIDDILERIIDYIPKNIVFSTPYKEIWRSYCNSFKHSLVCIDNSKDVAIVVYSYNQITGNISGQEIDNWTKSKKEKWCLDKLTLNGNLPLDIIEVAEVTKVLGTDKKDKDIILEIVGNRYFKINKDKSINFTTRLVTNKGIHSDYRQTYKDEIKDLLEKAGFSAHDNCIPFLAKSHANNKSKADAELKKVEAFEVNLHYYRRDKKKQEEESKEKFDKELKKIEETSKALFEDFKNIKEIQEQINKTKLAFGYANITVKLPDLKQGAYPVIAARKLKNTQYGKQYLLLIKVEGAIDPVKVWSNKRIAETLEEAEDEKYVVADNEYIYLSNNNLGFLNITGQGYNFRGHRTVYCNLDINEKENDKSVQTAKVAKETEPTVTPVIPRENLLPFHEYPNLSTLHIGSVHNVDGWGFVKYYGRQRLLISLDGLIYQARDHLEENVEQLRYSCKIKLEKIRKNAFSKVEYAVCSIYEKGDWTVLVQYDKTPILTQDKMDGETCILDVRTVDVKGKKRKLLLTDRGDGPIVYKLKKSKLEDSIKVGFI